MSEELLQTAPHPIGRFSFYKLGNSTLRQLKQAGLIRKPVPSKLQRKKPDGLVLLPGGDVKAVVEYKPPAELRTQSQIDKAIEQELEVAALLCNLLIVTSGSKTIWVNANTGNEIIAEQGGTLNTVFDAKPIVDDSLPREHARLLERTIDSIDHSVDSDVDQITPPTVLDPSVLARNVWQKIWINTGKEPEKCLYNVVELFLFKYLSDLGVLSEHIAFSAVYDVLQRTSPDAALKHYANSSRTEIQELFPPGVDGTTIINGTIFVNEKGQPNLAQASLFGEVLADLQEYDNIHGSLRHMRREFKSRLYESFLRQSAGVRFLGQYFTPRNVVQAMVDMSDASRLPSGSRICDPFCGVGGFVLECIVRNPHIVSEFAPKDGVVEPDVTVIGLDKGTDEKEDERTIILAKANMLIYLSDLLVEYHAPEHLKMFAEGALNKVFRLVKSNLGTFGETDHEPFDLILTNPPYVTSGSRSIKTAIEVEGLSSYYWFSGRGTESLAVEWIVNNLRAGGQALVVVPDGLMNQRTVLEEIKERCIVEVVAALPARTFYSTTRKTYILGLRKKRQQGVGQKTPVMSFLVGEIGESRDSRRLPMDVNHLKELVSLFNQFAGAPTTFATNARRCDLIPFPEFDDMSNWRVELRWGEKERGELGHAKSVAEISEEELGDVLQTLMARLDQGRAELNQDDLRGEPSVAMVSIGDEDVFEVVTPTTGWNREYLADVDTGNEEDVPVYSASADPVAHVLTDNPKLIQCDDESPLLSWASNGDGSAGKNFVLHTRPFYVSGDRMVVRSIADNLNLEYVRHKLDGMKEAYGYGYGFKANRKNVSNVTFEVPVDEAGEFDVRAQHAVVVRHRRIGELRSAVEDAADVLKDARVLL